MRAVLNIVQGGNDGVYFLKIVSSFRRFNIAEAVAIAASVWLGPPDLNILYRRLLVAALLGLV